MTQQETERYQIQEQIGSGGMATVYRARDRVLHRSVALKVLNRQVDPTLKERFRAEAQAVAQLNHQNVVGVYDVGERDGSPYIVMEYVDGTNLKRLIQEEGPLSLQEAVDVVSQAGAALAYAHRNKLIHCDVKPHNILLSPDGRAKLVDFGIAQAQVDRKRKKSEQVYGTPLYIAPEQAAGKPVSPGTDVYGLGLVLWEAVTGKAPERQGLDDPARLDFSKARLPGGLAAVIKRATAQSPADRYPSVDEMLRALRGWQGGDRSGRATTETYRPMSAPAPSPRAETTRPAANRKVKPRRKRRRFVALPVAALILLLVGLGGVWASNQVENLPFVRDVLGSRSESGSVMAPRFRGLTLAGAQQEANDAGLRLRVTNDPNSGEPEGTVVTQSVRAGKMVARGSEIALVVAGPPAAAVLPNAEGGQANGSGATAAAPPPTQAPPATPTITVNGGERVAQMSALDGPIAVRVVEDGEPRSIVLEKGQYLEARGENTLRIEADPAAELMVTLDGDKTQTLLGWANQFAHRNINDSKAFILVSRKKSAPASSVTDNSPNRTPSKPSGGNEKKGGDDKGRKGGKGD